MGYNSCNCAISPCQANIMYSSALFKQPAPYGIKRDQICEGSQDKTISVDETWDVTRYIKGSIYVLPGVTLTINCDLFLSGKIQVQRGAKLIVNGGTIASLCDEYWQGIQVWGNSAVAHNTVDVNNLNLNDPGVVQLYGATLLLPQSTTVRTERRPGWHPDHWGGIIQAEDVIFEDHRRGVAFMKYEPQNKSYFKDCTFRSDRGFGGVSMWHVNGVSFDRCTFSNMGSTEDYGIYCGKSSFKVVNNSKFEDLLYGIYSVIKPTEV